MSRSEALGIQTNPPALFFRLLEELENRLAKEPHEAGLLELRAELSGQTTDFAAQVADYTAAIKILSERPAESPSARLSRIHRRRGDAYFSLQKWPEAIDDYAHVVTQETTDVEVLSQRARANEALKKWDDAAADWSRAATANSNGAKWLGEFARRLVAGGQRPLATSQFKKSRAFYERSLQAAPDSDLVAMELAEQLLDWHENETDSGWTVLKPTEMKSDGGATLTLQSDGSILAGGKTPPQDIYTLTVRDLPARIQTLRLEYLPDDSLPQNGPGRRTIGDFVLTTVKATMDLPTRAVETRDLKPAMACADFSQQDVNLASEIDANKKIVWGFYPQVGKSQRALFELTEPVAATDGGVLRVTLEFKSRLAQHQAGRLRLSAAGVPAAFTRERHRCAAIQLADPWARLAAAYYVIGEQPAIDELVQHHPAAAAGIGDLYAAAQDWERAIGEYSKAITEQTTDGALLVRRSAAYEATRRWDLAAADWMRATLQNPGLANAFFEQARFLVQSSTDVLQTGQRADAIHNLQQARDRLRTMHKGVPEDGRVARLLAMSLGSLGRGLGDEHRLAEALEATQESSRVLEAIRQPTSMDLYNLACTYANLTTLVAPARASSTAAERESLANRAMDALRRALAAGMKDFATIDGDHDLDPLRGRADFRALILESAGRTREAVPYLVSASAANPKDTLLSLKVAALQAWFAQEKELAATRQRILALAKGTDEAMTAERAAEACSILPHTNQAEIEAALALGRTAVNVDNGGAWNLLALGMAEYRIGNDVAADKALLAAAEAVVKNDPGAAHVSGVSSFFRAMSLFRRGKKGEARKLATEAAAKMKPLPNDKNNPLAANVTENDLILWLAYTEAKAMIEFDAAPAAPATPDGI